MGKVTVNGTGGDILAAAAIDPEFHPTALDERVRPREANSPTRRNTIKGRIGRGKRLTRRTVAPAGTRIRDEHGRFAPNPLGKPLAQAEINRRGKFGY